MDFAKRPVPKVFEDAGREGAFADFPSRRPFSIHACGPAKRGRRELSAVQSIVQASRSATVLEPNWASERFLHHRLELGVAKCAFLLQVRANVFKFIVADAVAQPGAISVRSYLWIDVLGEKGRVRGYQWVVNQPKVRVYA